MKLAIIVGPPGSGKSTLATGDCFQGYDIEELNYVYINQDKQGKGHFDLFVEAVTNRRRVVIDRMNFNKQQRARYLDVAKQAGYQTEITVLHENYETCLKRCVKRENHETIKDETNARAALGVFFGKYERPTPDEADRITFIYPNDGDWNTKHDTRIPAIICDLDGTLCDTSHRQHFVQREGKKDWHGFFLGMRKDPINKWCADILNAMSPQYQIVYCSGRPDNYKGDTMAWLDENKLSTFYDANLRGMKYAPLYMRPRNDSRDDTIIKEIILDFEILTRYKPYFMIDDRKRVVDMWRRRGFTCLHCAEGEF